MAATLLSKGAIPHFLSDDVDDDNEVLRQIGMFATVTAAMPLVWIFIGTEFLDRRLHLHPAASVVAKRTLALLWAASLAIAVLHPWLLLGIYAIAPFLAWYAIERR